MALTAFVSVLSSVAVLVVAIPKGISTASEEEILLPQTSVPRTKGNVDGLATIVDATEKTTPAIPLGHNCWLVSATDIDHSTETWMTTQDGKRIKVSPVGEVEESGVVVVKAKTKTSSVAEASFGDVFTDIVDGATVNDYNQYRVVDAATQDVFSLSSSLTLSNSSRDIPVTTSSPIKSLAAVVDEAERVVGVVVRRGYSTWMLGAETLQKIQELAAGK